MLERYAYLWWRGRHMKRFLAATHAAPQIQQAVLLRKLHRNADSRFGREHGFHQIKSSADFRRHLPITDYEYYRPYVEQVKRGDLSAMFGDGTRLLMFALTSGTTSEPKHIPITAEFFAEYRAGWQLWGVATYRDHLSLVRKKSLQLSSDWQQSFTEAGIPCGNISGLAAETTPWVGRPLFIVPRPAIKIHDPFSKHYTALRIALGSSHIGIIVTANPSTLVEFARLADRQRESLVRDIFDGTLADHLEVPAQVRAALERNTVRRDPGRARQLEQLIERRGWLHLRDAWPQLSVLAVWTGGSVRIYLPQLKEYYGQTALRDHGLSASEGRMTIPLADGTSGGLLDFMHHYFEFIPEEEHDDAQPTVLEAHELSEGKSYYILLTTSSGLYRYDIRDVVRCVGFKGRVPVLEFLSKGAHFSSITGEKLSEFQVVAAVTRSFQELQLRGGTFTLAPVMEERPKYVLLVEPEVHGRRAAELAQRVDQHLTQLNFEYAEKRRTGRLKAIAVQELTRGAWLRYRQQRVARRGNFEEFKHPCLVNDPQFVERMLAAAPMAPPAAPHHRPSSIAEDA